MHTQVPSVQSTLSEKLSKNLVAMIAENDGWIGFESYMQMALYSPGLGYYSGMLPKFGEAGDFITAPEMGDLFAQCLAGQIQAALNALSVSSILEFGAGSGRLVADLLNALAALDALPDEYLILELSGELRARQQQTLDKLAGQHACRVRWLDTLPESYVGVVLANEVLDAMPVQIFEQQGDEVFELGVVCASRDNSQGAFCWQRRPAGQALKSEVEALQLETNGGIYRSEHSPQAQAWIKSLAKMLERGLILLIDYGFSQSEYYHPDRSSGTLMCHYQHRSHDDPFFLPGQQDITAHVDFSAIARSAQQAGLELRGYVSQGGFLLSAGLLDLIPLDASVRQQLELAQQVKKLTMPHEMGELFKVLALGRDCECELSGFAQQNHAYKL